MNRYKRILSFISFLLMFLVFFTGSVKVGAFSSGSYKYEWKEDSLVSGNGSIEKTFYVPQNMKCSDFVLSLKIRQSPTLIKELSSVSVFVNNSRAYSIMMDEIKPDGIVTIEVSDDLIYKGENSVLIKGFLKSTRERCETNNDVNWFVVEKSSSFGFHQSRTDSVNISDMFDNTYYSDGTNAEVSIALPDQLAKFNYSQASSLSALIGFINKNKEEDVRIHNLRYSELEHTDKETIVIGTADQIKAFDKDLLKDAEWKKAEENGYIAIRKIGIKHHFIVIVSNGSQIETFCKLLQNKESLSQIKGRDYVLDANKLVNEAPFDINPSLDSLGYGKLYQTGNGTKVFDYYFTIPARKTLTEDNKLTFAYSYSPLVDYGKGYVTAAVNGENIISKEFAEGSTQDKLELVIPQKYFDYTGFNISLKFELKPDAESCTSQSHDDVWVTVDTVDSNFQLELKDRTKFSLLNSQGLLQDANGYVEGNITVDSFQGLSTESVCGISSYLGRVSQGVNKLFLREPKEGEEPGGVIFSLTTSPIIKAVNDRLRIPVSERGEFVNKDLFVQNTSSLGAIQVTLNGGNLVLAASDKAQLNHTLQAYASAVSPEDTAVLKDGKIIDFFGEGKEVSEDTKPGILKVNWEIMLALAVLLAASICIFIIYHKKVKN